MPFLSLDGTFDQDGHCMPVNTNSQPMFIKFVCSKIVFEKTVALLSKCITMYFDKLLHCYYT